jgi:hypothetical protein
MLVMAAPAECSAGDRLIREVQFAHSLLNKTANPPKVSPSDNRRLVTERCWLCISDLGCNTHRGKEQIWKP